LTELFLVGHPDDLDIIQHAYLHPFPPRELRSLIQQRYDWTFTTPGDRLVIKCLSFENEQLQFDATLKLERRDWTSAELHRVIARFPMVTLKVIAAIHWQALRLFLKRVPIVHHPGPGHWTPSKTKHIGASW